MAVNSRPLYRLSYAGTMSNRPRRLLQPFPQGMAEDPWHHRGTARQNSMASRNGEAPRHLDWDWGPAARPRLAARRADCSRAYLSIGRSGLFPHSSHDSA